MNAPLRSVQLLYASVPFTFLGAREARGQEYMDGSRAVCCRSAGVRRGCCSGCSAGSTSPAWELAGELAAGLPLLALLLLVIWLVGSMFLKQTNGKRGLRVLFAFLGGGAALVIGAVTTIFLAFADIDHRADGWRVPEGVALEVPQNSGWRIRLRIS